MVDADPNPDSPRLEQERTPSRPEQAAGGAMATILGLMMKDLALASLTAAGTQPFLTHVASKMGDEWRAIRWRRETLMLQEASERAAMTLEDFAKRIIVDERRVDLAGEAALGAATARYDSRIVALGRTLASGILADDAAAIDDEFLYAAAFSALDMPHVMLLDLSDRLRGRMPEDPRMLYHHNIVWPREVRRRRPQLVPIYGNLVATLTRHHLMTFAAVDESDHPDLLGQSGYSCTDFGRSVLERLREAGLPEYEDV